MSDKVTKEADIELLMSALEHVTRWNELYRASSMQVINFYLLAAAIIGTAYVSAINAHQYFIAGGAGLALGAATAGSFIIFHRQGGLAHLADEPLAEVQARIADRLGIDSLRMAERISLRSHARLYRWYRSTFVVNIAFPLTVVASLIAAVYAWLQ